MEVFIQIVISGLETGSLYALAALGIVIIYQTATIVNFSQGEMAMFASFLAFSLWRGDVPYVLAFLGAILFAVFLGGTVHRLCIRPAHRASRIGKMIITLGLILLIDGLAAAIFGIDSHYMRPAIAMDNVVVGDLILRPNALFIIGVTVVIMLVLFYLLNNTFWGMAIRATSQDEDTARLMGVPVQRIHMLSWIIAATLGAITGVLVAPTTNVSTTMMMEVHLKSIIAAVLGGFSSFIGPVIGGFLIGIADNLIGYYVSLTWQTVIVYGLLIIVLVIKPYGILGKNPGKKV